MTLGRSFSIYMFGSEGQNKAVKKDGGILSQALRYGAGAVTPTGYGDLKFFDPWTHFTSSAYTRNLTFVVANDAGIEDAKANPAPHTGDSGCPVLWLLTLIASAAILWFACGFRRTRSGWWR